MILYHATTPAFTAQSPDLWGGAIVAPPLVVSIVAAGVSIWAIVEARNASARQAKLQERLVTIETARERDRRVETQRAYLRAQILGSTGDYNFWVRNWGQGEARAIDIQVNGAPLSECHNIIWEGELPSVLGSGTDFRFPMAVPIGSPLIYDVTLTWMDQSGEPGSWSSQLTI